MEVQFRTKQLEEWFTRADSAARVLGTDVARKYVGRILLIQGAADLDELKRLPGLRFQPLNNDGRGQWAVSLDGRAALAISVASKSPQVVQIEEVSRHYGD